jgi:hypothetical protein
VVPLDELPGPVTVPGFQRRVALALQVTNDDLTHDRLVVDDENGCHDRIVVYADLRRR